MCDCMFYMCMSTHLVVLALSLSILPTRHYSTLALQLNGFRIMLLLRLCPIVPFNGLNYIGGVTKVSPQDFTLALVGTLPFQLLLVIIGATTESLVEIDPNNTQELWLIIVVCGGIGFGIVAIIAAWKTCTKELQKVRYIILHSILPYGTIEYATLGRSQRSVSVARPAYLVFSCFRVPCLLYYLLALTGITFK
jgi:hypothetical protein